MEKNLYSETINKLAFNEQKIQAPHVVILGAGASLAAFPSGDKNGRKLPLMNNFVETVGLQDTLIQHGIDYGNGRNFETIFDEIHNKKGNERLIKNLEGIIYAYFDSLELPEAPTLYDHLILSLRAKDVIATFNWDPFLWCAGKRINKYITDKTPKLFFLHGNVAIAIDEQNQLKVDKTENQHLDPTHLLYPTSSKDYQSNIFIKAEWGAVNRYLREARMLTIFGYSAPVADIGAKKLLQLGWGNAQTRVLEEVELVNLQAKEDLLATWDPFIHTHHVQVYSSFYDTFIAKYPRLSCEAWASQNLGCEFLDAGTQEAAFSSPWNIKNFSLLASWFSNLLKNED